ncbi:oligosaccharide flippase family protein [Streptomyces sp. NPDC005538]|uniref:oligosaccharide flippase family protein n=1 Tax=unclassified Streptomyces TaxID=2593676 RepID=UPI0033A0A35E
MGYSALAQVAPLLTNLALTPYLIHHLGLDRFGVWSLILVLLTTLTVLDGGVGASLQRFFACHGARGDPEGTGRLVIGSMTVFVGLGALISGIGLAVAPTAVDLLDLPSHLRGEAEELFLYLGPLVTAAMGSNAATALLQAHGRFRSLAGVSLGSCAAYGAAVVLLVGPDGSLGTLAAVSVGRYLLLLVCGLCVGARHVRLRRPLLPDADARREFFGYALRMQLSGLTVFLNGQIDAFVIAALLPVRYVGIYAAGYQAATALRSLPLYAFPPIFTRMTVVYARRGLAGAVEEFHAVEARWLPVVLTYGAVTTATVAFAVQVWLGTDLALSGVVAAVLMAGYAAQVAFTGIRTAFVRATGRPGLETRYCWFATVVNLALTVPLTLQFGVVGVVLATAIGYTAGAVRFVFLCRRLADLREARLPKRWATATALGVITGVVGELPILNAGWHGLLPLTLAGLPVLAALACAAMVVAGGQLRRLRIGV